MQNDVRVGMLGFLIVRFGQAFLSQYRHFGRFFDDAWVQLPLDRYNNQSGCNINKNRLIHFDIETGLQANYLDSHGVMTPSLGPPTSIKLSTLTRFERKIDELKLCISLFMYGKNELNS